VHGLSDIHDPLASLGDGVLALGLVMARWLGLTLLMPVFSRTGMTGIVRGGFAFAMALPLFPVGMGAVTGLDPSRALVDIVTLTLKEGCIGLALGVLLGAPFWAAEMAGEFLDLQRGGSGNPLPDPEGMNQATVLGTLFVIAGIGLFLIAGGADVMAGAVYDSYRLWPLADLAPNLTRASGEVFVGLMQKMMTIALSVAAPLAIVTVASDILLGFIAKLAPSLNAYQMGAAIKSLLIAVLMPVYAQFFLGDLSATFGQLRHVVQQMDTFAK
jgi:type III secretion protein T